MPVKPVPDGHHTVTPYLAVDGADKIIRFLEQAFGAKQMSAPFKGPDGKIVHAEVMIGDSPVMIAEACEMMKATPSALYVYVPDVDKVYQTAVKAGGTSTMEPADMFYGDRCSAIKDPFGNTWTIATHKEDVSEAELKKRGEAFFKEQQQKQKQKAA